MKSMMGEDGKKDERFARTKAFALRSIRLTEALPDNGVGHVIKGQLLRCGTSVGAVVVVSAKIARRHQ